MSNAALAKRYAAALYESLGDVQAADPVRYVLGSLVEALGHDDLRRLLENPRFSTAKKQDVLSALADKLEAPDKVKNLLRVLAANDRALLLADVAQAFSDMVDEAAGRVSVTVTAAIPLPKKTEQQVNARVTEILGQEAEIRHRVDKEILGGLVVQIGSRVFDNSIRNHLAQLRQSL